MNESKELRNLTILILQQGMYKVPFGSYRCELCDAVSVDLLSMKHDENCAYVVATELGELLGVDATSELD